ncbi:hypothetical protein BC938DRAFT_480504, partial [Jimgerdemannia flammicorona]
NSRFLQIQQCISKPVLLRSSQPIIPFPRPRPRPRPRPPQIPNLRVAPCVLYVQCSVTDQSCYWLLEHQSMHLRRRFGFHRDGGHA